MAFLKVGEAPPCKKRRLYLSIWKHPNGEVTCKIGVASGSASVDRMLQQQRDYFMKYRSTCMVRIKRDREIPSDSVFKFETTFKNFFKFYQNTMFTFDGHSEHFTIDEEAAIQAYDAIIKGNEPGFTYYKEEDIIPF